MKTQDSAVSLTHRVQRTHHSVHMQCGHIHATSVSTFVNQVHKVLTAHGEGKYVMPPDMAAAWRKGTPLEHHPTRVSPSLLSCAALLHC